MCKKIRNGRDMEKILRDNNCTIRNGKGSHRVATLPNGEPFTYHVHGEYAPGIRVAFTKKLLLAGIILPILICSFGDQLFVIFQKYF